MLREKWRGNIFKLSLQVFSLRFTKDLRVWKNFLKKWSKLDQSFIKEKAIRPDFKRSINGKDRTTNWIKWCFNGEFHNEERRS